MIIMSKLVQKISWNLNSSGFQKELQTEIYMYGKASFKVNKAMQEPLEKLYQYENQPDMREKVKEYIGELETEIKRCEQCIVDNENEAEKTNNMLFARCQTLQEVVNDLKGRLEEKLLF